MRLAPRAARGPVPCPAACPAACSVGPGYPSRVTCRALAALAAVALVAAPAAHASQVVRAPHVLVWFDDPSLAGYAQNVADAAEEQLAAVSALFGLPPRDVTVRLADDSDVFNAFALPLPRPTVTLRTLFPIGGEVGFAAGDTLAMVLRHELTHLVQLTDTRLPPDAAPVPRVGLVGEGTAVLPPAWLLEGIATWIESRPGPGGRLDDPDTRALLYALAAGGTLPSLSDVSLATFDAWPGGRARYLLGASFLDALIRRHGFASLEDALHRFQAGGRLRSFSQAWRDAVGTDLGAEWNRWGAELARQAATRGATPAAPAWGDREGPRWAPSASPDGGRLAWAEPDGVHLAEVAPRGPERARLLAPLRGVEALTWLDGDTLVATAVARDPGASPSELFAVSVEDGSRRRLTHGAHAHLARATPAGCVLYLRDTAADGASLRRRCGASDVSVYRPPAGTHLVGLAVSPRGRVVLAAYRAGSVRLMLRTAESWRPLTPEGGVALDPTWWGEGTLLYVAEVDGVRQLFGLEPDAATAPVRLSDLLGGAAQPVVTAAGVLVRSYASAGQGFVRLDAHPLGAGDAAPVSGARRGAEAGRGGATQVAYAQVAEARAVEARAVEARAAEARAVEAHPGSEGDGAADAGEVGPGAYPVEPYRPWSSLAPYGWVPVGGRLSLDPLGAGLSVRVPAEDLSGRVGWSLTAGYDTALRGPLAGAYAILTAGWRLPGLVPDLGPPAPFGVGVSVGLWPHEVHLEPTTGTAFGVRAEALLRAPLLGARGALDVRLGLVRPVGSPTWRAEATLDGTLDGRRADAFGAITAGERWALRGRWTPMATGVSAGLWGEGEAWGPAAPWPGAWRVALRAGYRPAPPVPLSLPDLAAVATIGGRVEVPIRWRWQDGLYALERLDVEPSLHAWGGVGAQAAALGAGADLALWADTVLDYQAPVRFGVRAGYAQGWWAALALDWPF